MQIKAVGVSKIFQLSDGEDYRNVTIEFDGKFTRDVTVSLPISREKVKAEVKKYWDYHKVDLKKLLTQESDAIVGEVVDMPELTV